MTETQMTEVSRSAGKDALTYVALGAVTVLCVVLYLWLSFSPTRESAETPKERPWDLALLSPDPLEESDLEAVRALEGVDRAERADDTSVHIWVSPGAQSRAQDALEALAAARESMRAQTLPRQAEPDADALAALSARQEALDAQAQTLAEQRQRLDGDRAALSARETALNTARMELSRDGRALDEAEAQLSAPADTDAYREDVRRHSRERDAWYAGGEEYLDTLTAYEQARDALDRAEQAYAAALAAYEADRAQLERERRALRETEPEAPVVGDRAWQLRQNPEPGEPEEAAEAEGVSPLRLAMQMLFLAVAALSAWLFFARLVSGAAGNMTKPRPAGEALSQQAGPTTDREEEAFTAAEKGS